MSDEPILEEPTIEEPQLTQEEIDEQEIRQQPDFSLEVARTDDSIRSVIYTVLESKSLGKRVISRYKYVEETENGRIVGRLQQGIEKQSLGIDDYPGMLELIVTEIRPAERGR